MEILQERKTVETQKVNLRNYLLIKFNGENNIDFRHVITFRGQLTFILQNSVTLTGAHEAYMLPFQTDGS